MQDECDEKKLIPWPEFVKKFELVEPSEQQVKRYKATQDKEEKCEGFVMHTDSESSNLRSINLAWQRKTFIWLAMGSLLIKMAAELREESCELQRAVEILMGLDIDKKTYDPSADGFKEDRKVFEAS